MESKLRLMKFDDLKATPWKNGGGITREVAIAPPGASLDSFEWRVSIADVASDGPFSRYDGYDRKLVVWKGSGLFINGEMKAPLAPFEFAGEELVEARRVSDAPVKDFGVITKRGVVSSTMTTVAMKSDAIDSFESRTSFVLCASGEIRVGPFYLNPGDVVEALGGTTTITALEFSNVVIVDIN